MHVKGRNHMPLVRPGEKNFTISSCPLDIWEVGNSFLVVALSIDRVDLENLLSGCSFDNFHYNALNGK